MSDIKQLLLILLGVYNLKKDKILEKIYDQLYLKNMFITWQ